MVMAFAVAAGAHCYAISFGCYNILLLLLQHCSTQHFFLSMVLLVVLCIMSSVVNVFDGTLYLTHACEDIGIGPLQEQQANANICSYPSMCVCRFAYVCTYWLFKLLDDLLLLFK